MKVNWKVLVVYWPVYAFYLASILCSVLFGLHVLAAFLFLAGWNYKIARDIDMMTECLQELIDMPSCTVSFMAPAVTQTAEEGKNDNANG